MAKHIPDNHSPLLALGKKVLLWGLLPAGLIFTAFYVVDSFESPGRQSVRRAVEELSKERVEKLSHSPTVKSANELKASLAAKDDATTLQERIRKILELSGSKLEGEELRRVQEMTPAQLAEYEQKKLDGLNGAQKAAFALWEQAEAQRKLASAPVAAPATATCANPDDNLITGRNSRLVRNGADYKIVLQPGVKVPKGSVITDGDGTVIATATAEDTKEFNIKAGDVKRPGKLSVKIDPAKPETAAYVYVMPTDMPCLQPKGL